MTHDISHHNVRPDFDREIKDIAHYVENDTINNPDVFYTARLCLMDSLGCAMLALRYPECTKLLGPVVTGAGLYQGSRVPGTQFELDPVQAAFNIGTMIRWLDFNDTWLAKEWGHPSDNLGAILATADYLSRARVAKGKTPLLMRDVLVAMIKAHEIQGILALENSFNQIGFDHVVYVKVASVAVVTQMLGGTDAQICNALSQAFIDGQSLRTYRHSPNTGSRKSWAAGDATSRAVRLALITMTGEMGYPGALSAKKWGMYDVYFKGEPFKFQRQYGDYVMENILFKISYPAEFHSQTAVECAVKLHPHVTDRLNDIERIVIRTQNPAMRILNKTGPLYNPADRDHCLQYIVAVALLHGNLIADYYENEFAKDSRIDTLREKMELSEDDAFNRDYLDPEKRSIGNAIIIYFKDGSATEEVVVEYPIGHRRRRKEGIPVLEKKFAHNLLTRFPHAKAEKILEICHNQTTFENMAVNEFMDAWMI